MKALGKQVIVEFYNCDQKRLNDASFLEESLTAAAKEAQATVIKSVFHKFSPHGVTGVIVIAESHLSIHTWPEFDYAALDLFVSLYGSAAGNLALTTLAFSGVYLGGGIAPKILPRLLDGPFLEAFHAKGRYRAMMETLPVRVILEPETGLLGAAREARRIASV